MGYSMFLSQIMYPFNPEVFVEGFITKIWYHGTADTNLMALFWKFQTMSVFHIKQATLKIRFCEIQVHITSLKKHVYRMLQRSNHPSENKVKLGY